MKFFQNLSIRCKLQVIVMLISSSALVLTCTAMAFYEIVNFRQGLSDELSVLAKIVASRSASPLLFEDDEAAEEILDALAAKRSIVSAYIFLLNGNVFAQYHRDRKSSETAAPVIFMPNRPLPSSEEKQFEPDGLSVIHPIFLQDENLGTVFLKSDMEDMYALLRRYISVTIAVMLASGLLVFFLLSKLQELISKPILDLADAAKSFSENRSLSLSVKKQGDDELGILVDAFNGMLAHIIRGDAALNESLKRSETAALEAWQFAEESERTYRELENEMKERGAAEARLRESEEKYRNLFNFAPDGILITDAEGKIIAFNDTAMKVMSYDDRQHFSRISAQDFYLNPDKDRSEMLMNLGKKGYVENCDIVFKDRWGSPIFASVSARLILYEGKICIQSVIRDIGRIKKMEAELRNYAENLEEMVAEKTRELKITNEELSAAIDRLEETREQLSRSAHSAGMAEIAVSVLHNIGNAMTSVNVRIYQLEDRLQKLEIVSLEKIYDLLQSQDIAKPFYKNQAFLNPGDTARMEKLLKYFNAVIASFREISRMMQDDCGFIKKGFDHITEIISLQQKYAGIRGFETREDVNELLKDSLEMMKDSVRKRRIHLESDLTSSAPVFVNRNKLIQVFINIIKNAYEAIDAAPPDNEKKISLATSLEKKEETEYVQIVIADTGVGVLPEAADKVFRFNYSTKERGTGFGLHDAANYITAQNGFIRLDSEGLGKGAKVIIWLPVHKIAGRTKRSVSAMSV
ncbi:MAG: hypothetical protein BWK80_00295 [Desulfobacteraceae bacterium IS3]|nr:MAG: hypothetical protein BWK80_00295 [Desulfobacteraceae bacterium IS3]